MKHLIFPILFVLCACSSPAKKFSQLQETPDSEVASTPALALKASPPMDLPEKGRLSIDFDDQSPVVSAFDGKFRYRTIRFHHQDTETPYLVFSGSYHNVGFGKMGAVQPSVFVFDSKGKARGEVPLAQIGEDLWDGLMKKLKTAYSLKKLPPGKYSAVVVAASKDPTQPLNVSETPMIHTAGIILMPMKIDVFADLAGGCEVFLAKELPLKKDRSGVATFEK